MANHNNINPLDKRNTSGRRARHFVSYLPLVVLWFLGGSLLVFIIAPLINLVGRQTGQSLSSAASQSVVRDAIWLSLQTAGITAVIAVIFGTPLAMFLARTRSRFKGIIEAVVYLPLAVPHTVAGIALLLIFGKEGIFGRAAAPLGLQFYATQAGIVVAMLFVSVPFMVTAARLGFESVDPQLEKAARTLGESPFGVFRRVSLPLALGGILTGATLTFARSIAEIGAVIVLAYYPLTAPVEIYNLFLSFGLGEASAMAVLLLLVTLAILLVFRYLVNNFLVSAHS